MRKNKPISTFDSQNPIIYDNTRSEIISVTSDRLNNMLRDFEDCLRKRGDLWQDLILGITFLGVFLTVSDFKDLLGVSGAIWKAFFLLGFILSILKLLHSLYTLIFEIPIRREDFIKRLLAGKKKRK